MQLSELFQAEDLVLDFDPADKWAGIDALVTHLAESGRLPAERVPSAARCRRNGV